MVAKKLANMTVGGKEANYANLHNCETTPVSRTEAAALLNVSPRSVADAKTVLEKGSPELIEAVEQGEVSVSAAATVAKIYADEPEKQKEIVEAGTVKDVAREIKESRKPAETNPDGAGEILAAVISEVETLSQEFRDLDAEEMGVRFASILEQLADALTQLNRR